MSKKIRFGMEKEFKQWVKDLSKPFTFDDIRVGDTFKITALHYKGCEGVVMEKYPEMIISSLRKPDGTYIENVRTDSHTYHTHLLFDRDRGRKR